jgi:8-oxo-dGTP diphosphatase
MATDRPGDHPRPGYRPDDHPAFAVTVDVVILTVDQGELKVLLVRRSSDPYQGMWALPGGFKGPEETLEEAAARELSDETGLRRAGVLTQFGTYGDPGRDPRMNAVTVAYFAAVAEVGALTAGTDTEDAALWPVAEVVDGRHELAFDHRRIVTDAVERAGTDLETSDLATAFVGPEFTLSQLRSVYEAVWATRFDPANFRRSMLSDRVVEPTGKHAPSSAEGGRPPELFRVSATWMRSPVNRPTAAAKPTSRIDAHAADRAERRPAAVEPAVPDADGTPARRRRATAPKRTGPPT